MTQTLAIPIANLKSPTIGAMNNHDATSHWVKEINTVFIRAVDGSGNIHKVPFEMEQVPGSLTGEVLCETIIKQLSKVNPPEGKHNDTEKDDDVIDCYYYANN